MTSFQKHNEDTATVCTFLTLSHVLIPGVAWLFWWAGRALEHHVISNSHLQVLWDTQVAGEALPGHWQLSHIYKKNKKPTHTAVVRKRDQALMKQEILCTLKLPLHEFRTWLNICLQWEQLVNTYLFSIFEYIGSSMNASQWYRLYQAINNNDNRLHLIEVFREAVLWIMAHFLFHLYRWPTSIQLLASLPLLSPSVL